MDIDVNKHIKGPQNRQFSVNVRVGVFMWFRELVVEYGYVYGKDKPAYGKFLTDWREGKFVLTKVEDCSQNSEES